ncbi:BTAD domain-containing putative transcriptional regulator [Deinococcus yavapaiensis]|uniref:DNA-binding SARP family transcriptional activator n=1 Tax=Deinococcus yavapaiensis KR-236 TaxID=694435 RepID=A0A318S0N1_9DEIO|nr:BTAD domain-containing putative transcriptional regulator [Deinococcus yavapaiensis]PYE50535.1 DNA-binding SARP family transcriptional activator [Deinococcus yavapaiensis KR-236]
MALPSWHLDLFGQPRVRDPDGQDVRADRKSLALLAYLALEGVTPRSRLAGLLWPDTLEATARNNLVHKLRRLRARTDTNLVDAGEKTLALRGDVIVDVHEVLRDRRHGRHEVVLNAVGLLLDGVDFDDLPDFQDWLLAWRERLDTYRWEAFDHELARLEGIGEYTRAAEIAARWEELDPLSEDVARHSMRLQHLAGNSAGALRTYARLRRTLERELQAQPRARTRALAEEIERGEQLPALGTPPAAPSLPLSVFRPPALIGREDAWARMEAAWQAGQLIYLTGAPGTGKTRLALDFARSKGATLRLEHRPGDETVPYSSSARWARQMLRHAPHLTLTPFQKRELSRILPEFREGDVPSMSGDTDKLAFYEALAQVADLALANVTAVVSDDIQHDDDASQESGRYYATRAASDASVTPQPRVLLTFRQGELSPQADAVMRGLVESGLAVLIELQPLGVANVRALLDSLDLPFAPDLDLELYRYAGGNPLFVLETIKFLAEEGLLERGLPERLAPPGRTGSVLERRLARLSPAALNAARAASVLRGDFTLELVAAVLRAPLLETASAWVELEAAQVVAGERFSHDLLYEAVWRGTPDTVRRLLHRSAARVLAESGGHPRRVAEHWREGAQPLEAARWFEQAARAANAALRTHEAQDCYQNAAEAYEAAGDSEAARRMSARSLLDPSGR